MVDPRDRVGPALSRRPGCGLAATPRFQRPHLHQSEQLVLLRSDRVACDASSGRYHRAALCRRAGAAADSGSGQTDRHRHQYDILALPGRAVALPYGAVLSVGLTQMKRTFALGLLWTVAAGAQCAMCYRTAQALDAARGRALNSGILVLGMPPL